MTLQDKILQHAPLGNKTTYISQYQPNLLFPVSRTNKREEIGIHGKLPFYGCDIWNGYEISWLNAKGKPIVAIAEFIFPCNSANLIESKSFKLYLNSLNNTSFDSFAQVTDVLTRDLSAACEAPVIVTLKSLASSSEITMQLEGKLLDELDISCDTYKTKPAFLQTENTIVTETLHSNLLKSNCLVTGQPDWGSVQITYTGKQICHEGLLKYIVSYRNHNEFHEQCVERIYMDIMRNCAPQKLFVYARYTRRGGLDINPWRGSKNLSVLNQRVVRQ